MAFIDDFHSMMPDTVTAQPGYTDYRGDFIASGAVISIEHVRIEGSRRLVRTGTDGQQVISTVQLYLGGVYNLTTHTHRYTIPSRYTPHENLTAVDVQVVSDEDGPVNEVVYLP